MDRQSQDDTKRAALGYWIATGLFCAVLGFSGVAHTFHFEAMVESMAALGYPQHLMSIIGVAKLMGVAALLVPAAPLLKEWAYAGFAFNMLGAITSHILVGDPFSEFAAPCVVLLVGVASYLLRPPSRRIDAAPAFGAAS